MVLVVEDVHQIGIERMDIVQFREILDDLGEPIVEVLLCVFHFASVKRTDAGDFVTFVDHRWSFPLGFR